MHLYLSRNDQVGKKGNYLRYGLHFERIGYSTITKTNTKMKA